MSKETATVNRRRLWTVGAGAVGATALLGQAPAEATTPLDGKVSRLLLNRKSLSRKALERTLRDMGILDAPAPGRNTAPVKLPVGTPSGFSWTNHPLVGKLFVDQYGVFTTTLDPTTYKVTTGVTYYVDASTGNDANDGLSSGAPLLRISTAAAKSDVGTIMVKGYGAATPYYRSRGMNGAAVTKPINIISYGGLPAFVTTHDVLTWTLSSGKTYTYQAARSLVTTVYDMVAANTGDAGVRLTKVADAATVETTPGSWYSDGTTVWVRPSTNRAADANIWALLTTRNFENTGDWTTYFEGLNFYGGNPPVKVSNTSTGALLVANNCEFHGAATANNNVAVLGSNSILVNCNSTRASSDGYNYHVLNGVVPRAVEINCRASDNGDTSGDQQSTIHDGGKIIRVGGVYRNSIAGNVVDVNDGTESWMLGCEFDTAGIWNIKAGNDAGTVKMWLHGITCRASQWSVYAYGTAQVKVRGARLPRVTPNVTTY